MMRLIMFLFVVTFALAENNSLIKVNDSDFEDSILLKGEKENCVIKFLSTEIDTEKTTCLKIKNSKKINIFCTKNKEICKTEAEVSYFKVTGKKFPKKRSAKIPFIGIGVFNFLQPQCVEINKKGLVSFGYIKFMPNYGDNNEDSGCGGEIEGKWNDKYNSYWVDKYAVCKIENGNVGLCTSLDIVDEVTK